MRTNDDAMTLLLYSDDARTRSSVQLAVGRRPAPDVPRVTWVECATEPAVIRAVDKGGIDLILLDGEASPAGGMGICRQLKDEIFHCPPVIVLIGRSDDRWLATWSRADAVIAYPLDPIRVAASVAEMMRRHERAAPAPEQAH
jgi:DNA-binding response OmpR family regulator